LLPGVVVVLAEGAVLLGLELLPLPPPHAERMAKIIDMPARPNLPFMGILRA
jgi:hypothetical protein